MEYPLELKFRLLTFGQRITASDGNGRLLLFVKQKMFKLREQVDVYRDTDLQELLFRIQADRVLDLSANYHFTDAQGQPWGSVCRDGLQSLWSARYDIVQHGKVDMVIREENPMKKFFESVLSEIPIVGFLMVLVLNPSYLVRRTDGTPVLRLSKRPAIMESRFTVEKLAELPEDDELRCLLALMMLVLLERGRG